MEEEIEEDKPNEEVKEEDVGSEGSHSPGPERNGIRGRRLRRVDAAYEQAGEREEYAQAMWSNAVFWLHIEHVPNVHKGIN